MKITTTLIAAASISACGFSHAVTINLTTLTDSVMVGTNDTNSAVAPAAPGDGWYTSSYAGAVRGRSGGNSVQLRTQWNFRFDISALNGVDSSIITNATITIPQIGRLNNTSVGTNALNLYTNTYDWDAAGTVNYATWNRGRTDAGGDGYTVAPSFGSFNTHGMVTDTSNTNVEGSFVLDSGALLTAVQSWADDPADNGGFLMTYQSATNIGLAFGTPTLVVTIPEPSATALLGLGGLALMMRRRR